ncbi:MAG: (2Fe-2S)-binding protein [Acidimicrobiia bacterium]|jgi:aerobic carbon-monoxide dehydrogenase small subunit
MNISLTVDGTLRECDIEPGETLMEVLRRLGFAGVKNGCAHGDCGTCAVLVDGRAVTSCLLFAAQVDGAMITTVEGLASREGLHPLQSALLDTGGVQCGFCTPGIVMTALDLLARVPDPDEHQVRVALSGNLCRCTGYVKIVEGILLGAERQAASRGGAG